MAEFEVKVVRIDDVQEHPNADRLTLIQIGGYTCIANKHDDGSWRYNAGDPVVYVPEGALVPEWFLKRQGMWKESSGKGIMAGSKGNRVKPIRLRDIYSEGVLYPVVFDGSGILVYNENESLFVEDGQDVAEFLDITKYEPKIPPQLAGEVWNFGRRAVNFDLEPIEKNMDLISDGEQVVFMEKLHGTFTGISIRFDTEEVVSDCKTKKILKDKEYPEAFQDPDGFRRVLVFSKGLGNKGLIFKDNEANVNNTYVKVWKSIRDNASFKQSLDAMDVIDSDIIAIHILGETYGKGIQDLDYGADEKEFRVFMIGFEYKDDPKMVWISPNLMKEVAVDLGLETVPFLYVGPFSQKILLHHRDGNTTLGGDHIREGVVIYSATGRVDPRFGHIRLKSVSPNYKLRKNGTEFN